MKLFSKHFCRYLTPRCLCALVRQQIWRIKNPAAPWLPRQAVEILESRLKPTDFGLEWGSGRSTVWFAKRVAHLISIEHDYYWHNRVRKALCDKGVENVELVHVPFEGENTEKPEYVRVVSERTKGAVDFVLVDGCFRDPTRPPTLS